MINAEKKHPIKVSDSAAKRVGILIMEEDNKDIKLRVFVTGGGCSGFQYGFSFDENTNNGDTEVKHLGVCIVIDPMSYQYLLGSEIDYIEGLQGARFLINNPNAKTTCGCGSSFTV